VATDNERIANISSLLQKYWEKTQDLSFVQFVDNLLCDFRLDVGAERMEDDSLLERWLRESVEVLDILGEDDESV
jgi:uncharacterized protein YihD (DUF1040 family)